MNDFHERLKEIVRQALEELAKHPDTTVHDLLDVQNLATDFAFAKKYPAVAGERSNAPTIPSHL